LRRKESWSRSSALVSGEALVSTFVSMVITVY
jgi:hypothetical protein